MSKGLIIAGWLVVVIILLLIVVAQFTHYVLPFSVGDEIVYTYIGGGGPDNWVKVERIRGRRVYVSSAFGENAWVNFDAMRSFQIKRQLEKERAKKGK
jgi:hypothetical protein